MSVLGSYSVCIWAPQGKGRKLNSVFNLLWNYWSFPCLQEAISACPSAHQSGKESSGHSLARHSPREAGLYFLLCRDGVRREQHPSSPRPGSAHANVLQMLPSDPRHTSDSPGRTPRGCNSPFASGQIEKFGMLSHVSRRLLFTLFLLTEQRKSWAVARTALLLLLLLQMKKRVKKSQYHIQLY